jgi:aminoacyl tRNA synthase complex-interacting multifunctional protein 1
LYCEKINVCGEIREIASGLQKFVDLNNMKGKVIVMANLKPRPLAGFNSNGMVVCASNHEHTQVELIIPEGEIGERIYLEGH